MTTRTPSIEEVTRGLSLSPLEGISKATIKAIDKHNAEATALAHAVATLNDGVSMAVDSVANLEADSGYEFADALESRQVERLRLYQENARLWLQRVQVAEAMAADLLPFIVTSETRHAEAMAATLDGLNALGLAPDSMQAGNRNPTAAVVQQEAIARMALPVRLAAAWEHDAKARRNAAVQAVATSKQRLEESRAAVRRIAERAAALV